MILYILLCGHPPFPSDNEPLMFERIKKAEYTFTSHAWRRVSAQARDMVRKLLTVEPSRRLTASQALQHAWITGAALKVRLASPSMPPTHSANQTFGLLPIFLSSLQR